MEPVSKGRRFANVPTWRDFTRVIQAKTFYVALLAFAAGVTFMAVAVATSGTAQSVLLALGSTLLTSSVFAIISESMVRVDVVDYLQAEIAQLEQSLRNATPAQDLHYTLFPSRREIDWAAFIREATGVLRITGFSANDILSAPNCGRIFDAIAGGRIERLEVLLLNAESEFGQQRAHQPAYSSPTVLHGKVRAVLDELRDLEARLAMTQRAEALRYATINEPVTVSTVADANRIFVTPIVRHQTGGTSVTFEFENSDTGREYYVFYCNHFMSLRRAANW